MIPLRARFRRVNGPLDGLNGAILSHYGLERVDRIMVEQALIEDAGGFRRTTKTA